MWLLPSWSLETSGRNRQKSNDHKKYNYRLYNVTEENNISYESKSPHLTGQGRLLWGRTVWPELCSGIVKLVQVRRAIQPLLQPLLQVPGQGRQPPLLPLQMLMPSTHSFWGFCFPFVSLGSLTDLTTSLGRLALCGYDQATHIF